MILEAPKFDRASGVDEVGIDPVDGVAGIDPHKRSHTAAVLDDSEELLGQLRVTADRWQRDRLLRFAAPFEPRTWAVEAAGGLGALLAQQLVAAGECVVDVPPTLSARVR